MTYFPPTDSSSVDPTFHDRALHYFPSYQRPHPPPGESAETQTLKLFNAILGLFSQAVFTVSTHTHTALAVFTVSTEVDTHIALAKA